MYKAISIISAVLIVLLTALAVVQTVRLYRVQQELESKISLLPKNLRMPQQSEAAAPPGHLPGPAAATEAPADSAGYEAGTAEGHEDAIMQRLIGDAIESLKDDGGGTVDGHAAGGGRRASGAKAAESAVDGKGQGKDRSGNAGSAKDKDKQEADAAKNRRDRPGASADTARQLVQDARAALASADYDTAAKLLTQGLQTDPANKQAYQLLAQLQHNMGQTQAELQTYQDWARNVPGDALPHYMLASALVRSGDLNAAYRELNQFQSMSGGSLSSYPMAAGMYRQLGMPAEESNTLQAWIRANPDSPDPHQMLADYYRRNGNYGNAISEYQTVAALAPGTVSAYTGLADLYRRTGQYDAAEQQYQAAIELRPGDLALRQQLAVTYQAGGDLQSALSTYQSIIDANPNAPQAQAAAQAIQRIEHQLAAAGQ